MAVRIPSSISDPRQYVLVESMNGRFDRALTELNLAELI